MNIKIKHSQGIPEENIKSNFNQCSISLFSLGELKINQCYPKTALGLHYKFKLDGNSEVLSILSNMHRDIL